MQLTAHRSSNNTSSNTSFSTVSLHKYLSERDILLETPTLITYKKGEYIYTHGNEFLEIYEVVSGAVRISNLTENGDEVTCDILTQSDIFGNLKGLPTNLSETSKALTDTTIRIYNYEYFNNLKSSDPSIAAWFTAYLINRWTLLERRLVRINTCTTRENVAFLYKLFNVFITDSKRKRHLLLKLITQKDMADMVGATRQTVASVIKEMEHRGF